MITRCLGGERRVHRVFFSHMHVLITTRCYSHCRESYSRGINSKSALSLFKVSVPMELCLTVLKAGSTRGGGSETLGQLQQLKKIIRKAHRPAVFEVGGLIPDTRCATQLSKCRPPRARIASGVGTNSTVKLACTPQYYLSMETIGLTSANPCAFAAILYVYAPRQYVQLSTTQSLF